jgi:hypothetical protein
MFVSQVAPADLSELQGSSDGGPDGDLEEAQSVSGLFGMWFEFKNILCECILGISWMYIF